MIIQIIYSVFLGAWRRAFGCDGWGLPILKNRFFLHLIGFCVTFPTLMFYGYSWIHSLLATVCLFGLYWAIGHGPAFDMSRGGEPDKEMIKRYKKYFWNNWCEYIVPIKYWYGFGYDFLWMFFRYELPALLIGLILSNTYICFAGLTTSLIYAICWGMKDNGVLKKIGPTELAEIVAGVVTGFLLLA